VYELSSDVTERQPATSYSVVIDPTKGEVSADETVRYDELPKVDRERFADLGLDGDGGALGLGTTFVYTDTEREQSELVPEPVHSVVVWKSDQQGKFSVDDSYDSPLKAYRYSAKRIATAEEYGKRIRERDAFALSGLSADERDIVSQAIGDGGTARGTTGYTVPADATPSAAFASLADRFRDHETTDGGAFLVRYDGQIYWTTFHADRGAFDESADGTATTGTPTTDA
jgi:hypothetical protein